MTVWRGKRVLVTGATGLVGSWLVRRLLGEGAIVTTLILDADPSSELYRSGLVSQVNVVSGDLADFETVKRAVFRDSAEIIFHLGAQTIVGNALLDPVGTFKSNIQGTWNILEAARLSLGRVQNVLIASSDKAYGSSPVLPYSEDTPLRGEGPYDVSKSATDLLATSYALTYGITTVIARCGNIYGGGDLNWSRIVPGTIRSLLEDKTPVIRSDGKFIRDYVYVEDAVDAYMYMAEKGIEQDIKGEAFNFSRNEPISVLDFYSLICSATVGKYVQPEVMNTAKAEIHSQHLDSSKARNVLGWTSKISMKEGLNSTVSWYRNFLGK